MNTEIMMAGLSAAGVSTVTLPSLGATAQGSGLAGYAINIAPNPTGAFDHQVFAKGNRTGGALAEAGTNPTPRTMSERGSTP